MAVFGCTSPEAERTRGGGPGSRRRQSSGRAGSRSTRAPACTTGRRPSGPGIGRHADIGGAVRCASPIAAMARENPVELSFPRSMPSMPSGDRCCRSSKRLSLKRSARYGRNRCRRPEHSAAARPAALVGRDHPDCSGTGAALGASGDDDRGCRSVGHAPSSTPWPPEDSTLWLSSKTALADDLDRLDDLARAAGDDRGVLRARGADRCDADAPRVPAGLDSSGALPPGPEGYCPICGGWPALAEARGLDSQRRLRCRRCGGDWRTEAMRCPFCGERGHAHLGSLVSGRIRTRDGRRLRAMPTLRQGAHRPGRRSRLSTYSSRISPLLVLDLIGLERGYQRPAARGDRVEVIATSVPAPGIARATLMDDRVGAMTCVRPADACRALLGALDASEGRRRRRKRDTTPDTLGMVIKRHLRADRPVRSRAGLFRGVAARALPRERHGADGSDARHGPRGAHRVEADGCPGPFRDWLTAGAPPEAPNT